MRRLPVLLLVWSSFAHAGAVAPPAAARVARAAPAAQASHPVTVVVEAGPSIAADARGVELVFRAPDPGRPYAPTAPASVAVAYTALGAAQVVVSIDAPLPGVDLHAGATGATAAGCGLDVPDVVVTTAPAPLVIGLPAHVCGATLDVRWYAEVADPAAFSPAESAGTRTVVYTVL